ncbi:hypothetical protein QQZ08_009398 [Neonectria magnoliae]|uniref:FAD dependent oxidoreductase domain-containing protein n=1 Tax=Neonectria magnoliae TaxID=2732573 RepID=A0ABR1HNF4_9HYPO
MTSRNSIAKADPILIVGAGVFGLSTAWSSRNADGSSVDINRVIRVEYADELHYYSSDFIMLANKSGNRYLEDSKAVNESLGGELTEYSDASEVLTKFPCISSRLSGLSAYENENGRWADAEKSIFQLSQQCSLAGVNFTTGPLGKVIIATCAWSNRPLPMAHATTASKQPVGFIQLTLEETGPLKKMPVIINLSTGIFCFPPTPDANILKVARHGYGFATTVPLEDSPRAFKFLPVLGPHIADCFENKASPEIRHKWRLRLSSENEKLKVGDRRRGGPPLRVLAGHEQAKL